MYKSLNLIQYTIDIGSNCHINAIEKLHLKYQNIGFILDAKIIPFIENNNFITQNILYISHNPEKDKTIDIIEVIINKMLIKNMNRKSLIINIGGGAISDFGAFVASIYMRGIDFYNMPTTLLAAIDASIGGKNGINSKQAKNIIGTFNNPIGVLIDLQFLTTLSKRDIVCGFAEGLKHGIIHNKQYLKFGIEALGEIINKNYDILNQFIYESCCIKKEIVEADFYEQNIRKSLNFGHTVGHAIESLLNLNKQEIMHGEAVLIGMLIEIYIAHNINIFNNFEEFQYLDKMLKKIIFDNINLEILHMICNISDELLIEVMMYDKKNNDHNIIFALPIEIGKMNTSTVASKEIILINFSKFKALCKNILQF